MRRLVALSLAALAAVAARPAGAEDPKTYAFPAKTTWKAGDVATRVETESAKQKVTVGEMVVNGGDTPVETKFEAVMRVDAVDDQGEFTKAVVWFKSWSKGGETPDDSLHGAHVQIDGAGATRTVKVLTPGLVASPEALAWLDEKFGKGTADDNDGMSTILPGKPVAVGESWTPDVAKLAKTFGKDHMVFVEEKSKATGTLTSVKDGIGNLTLEVSLQGKEMATPQGTMTWAEGGAMKIAFVFDRSVDAGVHAGSATMHLTMSGLLAMAGAPPGGPSPKLEVDVSSTMTVVAGGEMPPVPEVK